MQHLGKQSRDLSGWKDLDWYHVLVMLNQHDILHPTIWHQRSFHETRPLNFLPQKALLFVSSFQWQGLSGTLVSLKEWLVAKLMETTDAYWATAWTLALCMCLSSAGRSSWKGVTKHSKCPPFSPQRSGCARPWVSVVWLDYKQATQRVVCASSSVYYPTFTVSVLFHTGKKKSTFISFAFPALETNIF